MKNILARGGIEFLAVLLGISGSLWIENNRSEKELSSQLNQSLKALKLSILEDKKALIGYVDNYEDLIKQFNFIQNEDSVKQSTNERLRRAFEQTTVARNINLDFTIFNAMESSGLIYKIESDNLRNKILKLYQSHYKTIQILFDYDMETVKKMDDIILNNFILSKKTMLWNLDYDHPSTRKTIIENQVFQNYSSANKSTKSIALWRINSLLDKIEDLLIDLEKTD